jgi:hypothetical protein
VVLFLVVSMIFLVLGAAARATGRNAAVGGSAECGEALGSAEVGRSSKPSRCAVARDGKVVEEQLPDGGVGHLIKDVSAGRPLGTLILVAGLYVLTAAVAEMAKESNFQEMDAAAQAFSRAQQGDRLMNTINLDLTIVVLLNGWQVLPAAGGRFEGTQHDGEATGCGDAGTMHKAPGGGGSCEPGRADRQLWQPLPAGGVGSQREAGWRSSLCQRATLGATVRRGREAAAGWRCWRRRGCDTLLREDLQLLQPLSAGGAGSHRAAGRRSSLCQRAALGATARRGREAAAGRRRWRRRGCTEGSCPGSRCWWNCGVWRSFGICRWADRRSPPVARLHAPTKVWRSSF